jgi:hypothetical protein
MIEREIAEEAMNPDRWRKVEEIFNRAIESDESCWQPVIKEHGDAVLRVIIFACAT